ncbi:Dbl homology domain-containing protein [Pilobolus umbonatus]|nr:Dbl homology domain-containing protein [Pilobolus umbonatus]
MEIYSETTSAEDLSWYQSRASTEDIPWYQSHTSSLSNQSWMESVDRDSYISFQSVQSKNTFGGQEESERRLPIINNRSSAYYQLMDDLSIIEDYSIYDDEADDGNYEIEVAEIARNVEHKKHCVQQLSMTEESYVNDMQTFRNIYVSPLNNWMVSADTVEHEDIEESCTLLFKNFMDHLSSIIQIHKNLLQEVRERQQIWGPTQFMSDVFSVFYDQLDIYDALFTSYPDIIVTLYKLFSRSSSFKALIEGSESFDISSHKFLHYLRLPIQRLPIYKDIINDMYSVTEVIHPDYLVLKQIKQRFDERIKGWSSIFTDRVAHIHSLESSRYIQGNPVNVSMARRLHIADRLVRVDPAHPRSVQDIRLYLLYSDNLIYSQRITESEHTSKKSLFKGSIQLLKAEVRRISPEIVAKITKVKKTSPLTNLMQRRKSEGTKSRQSSIVQDVYGFEIRTYELSLDTEMGLPRTIFGNIILRTKTEADQNMWLSYLSHITRDLAEGGKKFS